MSQAELTSGHDRTVRRHVWLLLVTLPLFYLGLQNGQWVPANDSDVYLAVARNLYRGRGFVFNGVPIVNFPPTWPAVLAAALRVSPSFRFLNLLPLTLLCAVALLWYFILLRLTSPSRACLLVLIWGALFHTFRLSSILYTDSLYFLFLGIGLLTAFRSRENGFSAWRVLILLLMSAGVGAVRWAGVLGTPLLAGAVVQGEPQIRVNRRWFLAAGCVLAGILTVAGFRHSLVALAECRPDDAEVFAEGTALELQLKTPMAVVNLSPKARARYAVNVQDGGLWISRLFWQPFELGSASRLLGRLANALGWVLLAIYTVDLLCKPRGEQWLGWAALGYCGLLFVRWHHPNVRYLLPVAPFLLLGVWDGMRRVILRVEREPWRRWTRAVIPVFLGSIVAVNTSLYFISVRVAQAEDYYAAYRAGQCDELIGIADQLNRAGVNDSETAISYHYFNLDRPRSNSFGLRAAVMLTDRIVRVVPPAIVDPSTAPEFAEWAAERGIRYLVHRPPVNPWRVWHFRAPALQKALTGKDPGQPHPFFELYESTDEGWVPVEIPKRMRRMARVPHTGAAVRAAAPPAAGDGA